MLIFVPLLIAVIVLLAWPIVRFARSFLAWLDADDKETTDA